MENIQELVKNAANVAIIPASYRGKDAFCAGAALFQMLRAQGTNVSFLYSSELPEGCEDILDTNLVEPLSVARDLIVSIDYSKNPTAQLHYNHSDDGVLHLKLGPVAHDFDLESDVRFNVSGTGYDLVIMVGVHSLESLGMNSADMADFFKQSTIINIDNSTRNKNFGKIDLVDSQAQSVSMVVFNNLHSLGLTPTVNSAKSLLKGIAL